LLSRLLSLLVVCTLTTANHLKCDFNADNWIWVFDFAYKCTIKSDFSITSRTSTLISSVNGHHWNYKSNSDVNAFYASYRTINYFPRGLNDIFPNIKTIYIWHSGLKEVHQKDLQSLTNLVVIDLWDNEITTIPKGLFDYNSNLQHISFTENKITSIDSNVFNNLLKLTNLLLDKNSCIDFKVVDNHELVMEEIRQLEHKCQVVFCKSDFE